MQTCVRAHTVQVEQGSRGEGVRDEEVGGWRRRAEERVGVRKRKEENRGVGEEGEGEGIT